MNAKSNFISFPDVLKHFNEAAKHASQFQKAQHDYPSHVDDKHRFEVSNRSLLSMPATDKMVLLAVVPLHFGTAIFEAVLLMPILLGVLFWQSTHSYSQQVLLATLLVCTLLGASLIAGFCFQRLNVQKDMVVPGRRKIPYNWLLAGILMSFLYVSVVLWVVSEAGEVDAKFEMFYLLGLIALIEVALSIAAVIGYTLLIQRTRHIIKAWRCRRTALKLYYHAENCALSFRYYKMSLSLYNQQETLNLPAVDSPAILEAIDFHEGYKKQKLL
jgi:hypothetical protein